MNSNNKYYNLHIIVDDKEIMVFRALSSDSIEDMVLSFVSNGKETTFKIVNFEEEEI